MNKHNRSGGINPQVGITAQNWAALSMFVQHSFDASFEKIQLEKAKLADFVLVFNNRRIICESKNYHISYADIKKILDSIPSVGPQDEVVIICKSLDEQLQDRIGHIKFFPDIQKWFIKEKDFTERQVGLLPKLKFWEVDQSTNESIVKSLMEQRFSLWLPNTELIYSTLIDKIFSQSAKGGEYTKTEFLTDIASYRDRITVSDDASLKTKPLEVRVKEVLTEISNPTSRLASSSSPLQVLVTKPNIHGAAFDVIKKMDPIRLEDWDLFWKATYSTYFSRELFSVLKAKISSLENAKYAINFVASHADSMRYKVYEEYQYKEAAELLIETRKLSTEYDSTIAKLLMGFYRDARKNVLFVDKTSGTNEWVLGELAKGLERLFSSTDQATQDMILEFIYSDFNLIEDDSKYWHETPPPLFDIIRAHIGTDAGRLEDFIVRIINNYNEFYKRFTKNRPAFRGWELMGGGSSTWAGEPHIEDRKFLEAVIIPSLEAMEREQATEIISKYTSYEASHVSHEKPDFMNRAEIPFLIKDYVNNKRTDSAFEKLSAFIKMRKGIPDKKELIYNAVQKSDMDLSKKWELLKVGIDEYGQPINAFMDRILWQLFDSGSQEVLLVFGKLLKNDDYMERQKRWDSTIPQAISRIIKNEKTFDRGVSILRVYLKSKHFNNLWVFDAYGLRSPVLLLLEINTDLGIEVLKELIVKPTANQQAAFGSALRDLPGSLHKRVYEEIIQPLLTGAGNAYRLSHYLTSAESRENIVWFAEKLAKQHAYAEALEIARFFISDPDPAKDNEQDQHILDGKTDSTITTVRGCLPWVLMPFATVGGRDYVSQAFDLTKKLCLDESLYVREQGLLALETMVDARHTHIPKSDEWFMTPSLADSIESLAFTMLRDQANHHPAILKRLARVFNSIHTVNHNDVLEIIGIFESQGGEVFKDLAGYIIYMAEFRYKNFKQWPLERGNLGTYDPDIVRDKLQDLLVNGQSEIRRSLAWQLSQMDERAKDEPSAKRLREIEFKYLSLMTGKYDHLVFESIYRFVARLIDVEYDETYRLWKAALQTEKSAILEMANSDDDPQSSYAWWPYFYNGSILLKVAERSFSQLLEDLELLLGYPSNVLIANDLDAVVDYLAKTTEQIQVVDRIFKKLLERNANFYHRYESWQKLNQAL